MFFELCRVSPAALWWGEEGPDLGVRACVRTRAPLNPGIYHGISQ